MIIIGEKINGSIPAVADAIARRDAEFIKARAIAQEDFWASRNVRYNFLISCPSTGPR